MVFNWLTLLHAVEDSPYMIGVLPSCVEVRAAEPRLLVQRLELPRARLLSPVISKHGRIYVASASHIWCLHLVPVHQQLPRLLEDKHFQLAIELAVIAVFFVSVVIQLQFSSLLNFV